MADANKIKGLVKKPAPPSTFGTDPKDPWSTKANLNEDMLADFLRSRGINPQYVSMQTKVSHAKSFEFKKWVRDRKALGESITTEPTHTQKRSHDIQKSRDSHKEIKTPPGPGAVRKEEVSQKEVDKFHKKLDKLVHSTFGKSSSEKKMKEDLDEGVIGQAVAKVKDALARLDGDKTTNHSLNYKRKQKLSQLKSKNKKEKTNEEVEQIDEISKELANRYMYSAKSDRAETDAKINKAIEKQGEKWSSRRHKSISKMFAKGEKRTQGISRALDRLTKEETEQVDEVRMTAAMKLQKAFQREKEKRETEKKLGQELLQPKKSQTSALTPESYSHGFASPTGGLHQRKRADDEYHNAPKPKFKAKSVMDRPHTVHIDGKPWKKFDNGHQAHKAAETLSAKGKKAVAIAHFKEDVYQDPKAATQTVFDGGNNTNDLSDRKRQMSKSARMIKALYKKKGVVKEDLYDHEKDDKGGGTYGKKPKLDVADKDASKGENKPQAAAVLSGGKTMTGSERDTVELDPMMRNRPSQPDVTKKDDKDKDGKKDDKKKDK